jgi:lipopolysaccharide transport system ATP-binding protein
MGEVARGGRTVLFVSHNMSAVERLCASVLYLDKGKVLERSTDVRGTISRYMHGVDEGDSSTEWHRQGTAFENRWYIPTRFAVVNADSQPLGATTRNDADMFVEVDGIVGQTDPTLQIGYNITTEDGTLLYSCFTTDQNEADWPRMTPGPVRVRSRIPSRLLNEGDYRIELCVALFGSQWICEASVNSPAIRLTIEGGMSESPYFGTRRPSVLSPIFPWERVPAGGGLSSLKTVAALSSIGT